MDQLIVISLLADSPEPARAAAGGYCRRMTAHLLGLPYIDSRRPLDLSHVVCQHQLIALSSCFLHAEA